MKAALARMLAAIDDTVHCDIPIEGAAESADGPCGPTDPGHLEALVPCGLTAGEGEQDSQPAGSAC